ncbi:PIG-L family deacetylase [Polycladomyces sp. WAk]|uniref:PIG-L family deacetylase n=1 Tax=Polycladomyces zharkentensis TaxID=2807616 RepID=A0ABS2WJL3_9BACL|nr:PIG-L deacetylase family protein [Polycladomyces sp. WAk]MBN2909708.1 PIG-L family deacetylase [Polycladomyces sp. WAk]
MTRTALLLFAHPDDETFTCGGTIAKYAHDPGVRIILYCATRGEAGKVGDPPLCRPEELGDVRERELARAAKILGIHMVIQRNFGDGKLSRLPREELTKDILQVMEKVRPDVIVTFPPDGISGHADHRALHQAVVQACDEAKNRWNFKLYYVVIPRSTAPDAGAIYTTPDDDVTTSVDVTAHRQAIMEALRQHRTQHLSIERVFPGVLAGEWQRLRTTEYYQLAMQNGRWLLQPDLKETDWWG